MKNKNRIWLFGSWSGKRYCDNSRYLFEFVSKQPMDRAVWLSRDNNIIKDLRMKGFEAHTFFSMKTFYLCFKSSYIVLSYSYDDVTLFAFLLSRSSKIIQLWHGTPLKRLDRKMSNLKILFRKALFKYLNRELDFVISPAEIVTVALKQYFRNRHIKFIKTGYPRNDGLFLNKKFSVIDQEKIAILYTPTFRDYNNDGFNLLDFSFDKDRLEGLLEKFNAILYIKLHPVDYMKHRGKMDSLLKSESIKFISDLDIEDDLYAFLANMDVLITDYSSIFFDYLLLNRPIIFSCFDKEDYISKDRGFYFSYDEVTPGPHANNWIDVENALALILSEKDDYSRVRVSMCDKFNEFKDNKSSERVYYTILES